MANVIRNETAWQHTIEQPRFQARPPSCLITSEMALQGIRR